MKLRRLALLSLATVCLSIVPRLCAQSAHSGDFVGSSAMTASSRDVPGRSILAPVSSLPPQRSTRVFGQRIVYYDTGTGPTLVLVHGFGSQARFDWGNVIVPLSRHHRVIALDEIGWGGSDKPFIDYSIQTFVDFLGEFLRTLKVEKFDLAGESLGGWIVADYTIEALAATNTGPYALPRPARLILEDAAGHNSLHSVLKSIPITGTLQSAAGVAIVFHDKSLITPEFIRENFALKLAANDGMTQRLLVANPETEKETVGDKVAGITVPTLVVWGGDDQLLPLADGKDYAAKIAGAKLVIVPECGHAPSLEKPKEFVEAVEGFLGR
jgi:pimeloyl-ACP methyl ester carboxylesterase